MRVLRCRSSLAPAPHPSHLVTATPIPAAVKSSTHISLSAVLLVVLASACFTIGGRHSQASQPALPGAAARLGALGHADPAHPRDTGGRGCAGDWCARGGSRCNSCAAPCWSRRARAFSRALKYLPMAEATALNFMAPMLVTLMAGWFLGEHLTRPRWAFVVAGFIGMLLIVRPRHRGAASGGVLRPRRRGAVRDVSDSHAQARRRRPDGAAVLSEPGGHRAVLVACRSFSTRRGIPISDILLFVGIGIMGFVGHLLFIKAFQVASASAIAPFTYSQLVWSTLRRLAGLRFVSGRLDAIGDRGHRRQRRRAHVVRALAGEPASGGAGGGRLSSEGDAARYNRRRRRAAFACGAGAPAASIFNGEEQ